MSRRESIGTSALLRGELLPSVSTVNHRIICSYAIGLGAYHAVALLALLPWFCSWTGVTVALVGSYVFGTLGMNIYYHRLLTQRGLTCAPWLERIFAVLAVATCKAHPPIGSLLIGAITSTRTNGPIRIARWSTCSGVISAGCSSKMRI